MHHIKARGPVIGIALAFAVAAGCTVPNPDFDPAYEWEAQGWQPSPFTGGGQWPEGEGAFMPEPPVPTPAPTEPTEPTEPEPTEPEPTEPPTEPEPTEPEPDPPPPPSVLGQLCTDTSPCTNGELCLYMSPDATQGICLQECNSPDHPCPVPDPKYFSGCVTYFNTDVGTINVCAIFCRLKDKTFPCPASAGYTCKDYGQLGVCVPE